METRAKTNAHACRRTEVPVFVFLWALAETQGKGVNGSSLSTPDGNGSDGDGVGGDKHVDGNSHTLHQPVLPRSPPCWWLTGQPSQGARRLSMPILRGVRRLFCPVFMGLLEVTHWHCKPLHLRSCYPFCLDILLHVTHQENCY